jgi:peptide-methionine (S)-S-oxide reductase
MQINAMKTRSLIGLIILLAAFGIVIAEGNEIDKPATANDSTATAIFAGGCFWSIQKLFDHVEGVISTTAGFTGGTKKNPSYEDVSYTNTGHLESVKVVYDPQKVSYEKLLSAYWHDIDPTTKDQAFCDSGPEYNSAVFYTTDEQKRVAEASKAQIEKTKPFKAPILTTIRPASEFYAAEDYHQEFYKKNPVRYQMYKIGCQRDARLKELWGDQRD